MVARRIVSLVVGILAACASGGHTDTETHWVVCSTDADCARGERCEAARCLRPADAGVRSSGSRLDAATGSGGSQGRDGSTNTGAGGRSSDASTRDDASVSDASASTSTGGAVGSGGSNDGAAALACLPTDVKWNTPQPTSAPGYEGTAFSSIAHGRMGVAADGSAFTVWDDCDFAHCWTLSNVSRYAPGVGWTQHQLVSGPPGPGAGAGTQVAVSANGEAMVLWGGTTANADGGPPVPALFSTRYAGGWEASQFLEGGQPHVVNYGGGPIEADAHGNFITVLGTLGGSVPNPRGIEVARYARGTGWNSTPIPVEDEADAGNLVTAGLLVAVEPGGGGVVVWSDVISGGGTTWIHAVRYTPQLGWSGADTLATVTTQGGSGTPSAAIDAAGNVVVIWLQENAARTGNNLMARSFSGGVWSDATTVDTSGVAALVAFPPKLATDHHGRFIATWTQRDPDMSSVYASQLTLGGQWSAPVLLSPKSVPADGGVNPIGYGPAYVAMGDTGDAVVALTWHDSKKGQAYLSAAAYSPVTGWETTSELSTEFTSSLTAIPMVDKCGVGTVIFATNLRGTYSARHRPGVGWAAPVRIDSTDPYEQAVGGTTAAIGPNGQIAVGWETLGNEKGDPGDRAAVLE